MNKHCSELSYVLVTPARNEGAFIEKTIQSVIILLGATGQGRRGREVALWRSDAPSARLG